MNTPARLSGSPRNPWFRRIPAIPAILAIPRTLRILAIPRTLAILVVSALALAALPAGLPTALQTTLPRDLPTGLTAPASAQPPGGGPGGGSSSGSGGSGGTSVQIVDNSLLVTAGFSSSLRVTGRPGPGSGPRIRCGWFRLVFGGWPTVQVVQVRRPVIGGTYLLYCWYGYGRTLVPGYPLVRVYRGPSLPGSPTSTTEVSRWAVSRIAFERPSLVLNPAGNQIAGVPTWLGVDGRLDYACVSAAAGPVWAAVRPVFKDVVFEMPNGDVVVCARGPATDYYDPAGPPGQTNDCSYPFSSTGRAEIKATLRWRIWQRTDRNPREHYWGMFTLATRADVVVGELQAVIN